MTVVEWLLDYGWTILIIAVVVVAICHMVITPSPVPQSPECKIVCESKGYSYKETNMNDCYCFDNSKCYSIENRTYCENGGIVKYSRI